MAESSHLPIRSTPSKRTWKRGATLLVLLIHAALLAHSAAVHSPVIDESAHLASGLSHWRTGSYALYRVNPPLVRMVATLPLLLTNIKSEGDRYPEDLETRSEFVAGDDLVEENSASVFWYTTIARWACIPFSLLGAVSCQRWAQLLFGKRAGLAALALWCASPTFIGHGSLLTPDMAATSLGLLAAWHFSRWLSRPAWRTALMSGVALGLAECSKSTWLILFALWPLLWLVYSAVTHGGTWRTRGLQLATMLLVGWASLVSIYALEGLGSPLSSIPFQSKLARQLLCDRAAPGNFVVKPSLADVPLPLPRNYVAGLDRQYRDLEGPNRSYLRGEWRDEGWWYYYLYGLGVKEPCGLLLLALLAAFLLVFRIGLPHLSSKVSPRRLRCWMAAFLTLAVPTTVLVIASANVGMNHHVRYVMPVVPYVIIIASAAFVRRGVLSSVSTPFGVVMLAWVSISSVLCYPNSLSYFNELAGGPTHGIYHLNNSNVDWGQDLLALRDWKRNHLANERLHLAYFGRANARIAGIEFEVPPQFARLEDLKPGWYAVSVTLLQGRKYQVFDFDGGTVYCPDGAFAYLNRLEPTDRVGYSIVLFHIQTSELGRSN
jgi:4-amino-4-deoxy-L-arabinose transferase-like glycosyltransferase